MAAFTSRDALYALVALGCLALGCLALGSEQLATGFAFSASTVAMAAVRKDEHGPPPPRTRTRTPPRGVRPPPLPTDPHVPIFPDDDR